MIRTMRALLLSLAAAALVCALAGCAGTVKRVAADALFYQVKKEKPLTQADMDTLVNMIQTQRLEVGLGATRAIYVAGKTATGLVRQYAGLAQLAGLDPQSWTVPNILALLEGAGLVEKGQYDYLRGLDLKIFDPTDEEAQVIDANKLPLALAIGRLALAHPEFLGR